MQKFFCSRITVGALSMLTMLFVGSCGDGTTTEPDLEPDPTPVVEPDPTTESQLPVVLGLETLPDENAAVGVVEFTLAIGTANVSLVPGAAATDVWAYNGLLPGPLLQMRLGETVRITATNNLDEPTTIHWHGLRIDYRMDGVVLGSLPAIGAGETFVYEFTPPEAGTFWYHPHMRTAVQVERGLYGMLIVHEDEGDRPDVDADRAMVLDDIRLNDDGSIAPFATSGMDIVHGRTGNTLLLNGTADGLQIELKEDDVERWRLVNTANAREMTFRFPGLSVKRIGGDAGLWPQSLVRTVDEISLAVGARAELEVRLAPGASSGSLDSMIVTQDNLGNVVLSPFTMVEVSLDSNPRSNDPRLGYTGDAEFAPMTARLDVDKRLEFEAFNINGQLVMQINELPYPNAPIWNVEQGELEVIKVINRMPMSGHPFHLHGQFFQIVARDGEPTDEPGWHDTVQVPAGGNRSVTIATYFDNPGTWLYHCHILEHAEAGMMAVVEVAPKP